MNFVPVITHAVAILLGWLVVSFGSIHAPDRVTSSGSRNNGPAHGFRSARSELRTTPSSLLSAQAQVAMDPKKRAVLKRRVLMDWATSDPDGLLAYLDNRPWLSDHWRPVHNWRHVPWESEEVNALEQALKTLAKARPADLVGYAKREGCHRALNILCDHADPRLVVDLLLSLPPESLYPNHFATVFERGCAADPAFHQRIIEIEDPEFRFGAFEAVATVLLRSNRDEALFPWLAQHADTMGTDRVLGFLSTFLIEGGSDLNRLSGLPEPLRSQAIPQALYVLAGNRVSDFKVDEGHHRDCLTTCIKNGWLESHLDLAQEVVTKYYRTTHPRRRVNGAENNWRTWALNLPADPKWHPLRRTAIRRWALQNPDQWNTIADLPTEDLRNAAYTAVVHNIDTEEHAERLPWILEQITDSALRNVAAEVLTARIEDDSNRPLNIDPFRPLGVR